MKVKVDLPIRQIPESKWEELIDEIEDIAAKYGARVDQSIIEDEEE